jgi:alanine racemase
MYRNTYAEIDLNNIISNVKAIINKYNDYKYYFGVVKADAYGHTDLKVVKALIAAGCNYMAVSSLEEAIKIRKKFNNIPILCLEPIDLKYIEKCIIYNITITISSKEYLQNLLKNNCSNLKMHIKLDTGMNRLGIKDKEEFINVYNMIKNSSHYLEGIYSHIYWALNDSHTKEQLKKFENMICDIDISSIPIIHISNSETLVKYKKMNIANGVRLGIIMYGFTNDQSLELKSTYKVISEIIEIKEVKKGETIGYNGTYKAIKDIKIGIVPIGYADGIIRANKGRYVIINDNKYPIVGNICMDMLMVHIDQSVQLYDKVYVIKDIKHINDIAKHTKTIPYEVICMISKRVSKKYKISK